MNLKELIHKISEEKPEVLGKVPQGKALAIIREVLTEIKREIEASKVKFPCLAWAHSLFQAQKKRAKR